MPPLLPPGVNTPNLEDQCQALKDNHTPHAGGMPPLGICTHLYPKDAASESKFEAFDSTIYDEAAGSVSATNTSCSWCAADPASCTQYRQVGNPLVIIHTKTPS